MNNARGITLVELMIAAVVLSVVFLAILSTFGYITKALVQTRLKSQVLMFAKAELEHMERHARFVDTTQGKMYKVDKSGAVIVRMDGSSETVWRRLGYDAILADTGTVITYPRQFAQDVVVSDMADRDRYNLIRVIGSTVVFAGNDYEYKGVEVTLSDTVTPPRFTPVSIRSKIKKPDQKALDTRTSSELGSIYGFVTDVDNANTPIAGVNVYLQSNPAGIGPFNVTTGANGRYDFFGLDTSRQYDLTFTKSDWWSERRNTVYVNTEESVKMRAVYYAKIQITVRDNSGNNLRYALPVFRTDSADYKVFEVDGITLTNSARIQYSENTNAAGFVTYTIPIPVKGDSTYSKYIIDSVSRTDYVPIYPKAYITLDKNTMATRSYELIPASSGTLKITVLCAETSIAQSDCRVDVYGLDPNVHITHSKTDARGEVAFYKLVTNTPSEPLRSERLFKLLLRKTGARTVNVSQGTTAEGSSEDIRVVANNVRNYTVRINTHSFSGCLITPVTSNASKCQIPVNTSRYFRVSRLFYNGVKSTDITVPTNTPTLSGDVVCTDIRKIFRWEVSDSKKAWLSAVGQKPLTSDDSIETESDTGVTVNVKASGTFKLDHYVTYQFRYPEGGLYGSSTTATHVSLGPRLMGTSHIQGVAGGAASPTLSVAISGPDIIAPLGTMTYNSIVNHTGEVGTISYTWIVVAGPGNISPTNTASTNLTATGALGSTIGLRITINSASGHSATYTKNIQIGVPELGLVLSYNKNTEPGASQTLKATVSNGSEDYSYEWVFCDSAGNPLTNPYLDDNQSHLTNHNTRTPTYIAGFAATNYIKCTVTDTNTNATTSRIISITVNVEAQAQ